jgi:hypothetical protein
MSQRQWLERELATLKLDQLMKMVESSKPGSLQREVAEKVLAERMPPAEPEKKPVGRPKKESTEATEKSDSLL